MLFLTAGIAWFYTLFWEGVVTFLVNPSVSSTERLAFVEGIVFPGGLSFTIVFAFVLWSLYSLSPRRFPVREILDGLFGLSKGGISEPSTATVAKPSRGGQKFDEKDRDIELKILDLASEEHRTWYYAVLEKNFAVLGIILGGEITFSVSVPLVGIFVAAFGAISFFFIGVYVVILVWKAIVEYKSQRQRVDELIVDIQNGMSLGSVGQALRRLQE